MINIRKFYNNLMLILWLSNANLMKILRYSHDGGQFKKLTSNVIFSTYRHSDCTNDCNTYVGGFCPKP
jgi:hypothetical protein